MSITTTTLTRSAGVAAALAGAIFIGVQINHPYLDATSVTTTQVVVRDSLKVLMAVLALAGISGMYLFQVKRTGVLGLVGWLLLSVGYLLIASSALIAAYVLPHLAGADPGYVNDVLALANGRSSTGDVGALRYVLDVQGFAYLGGGLVFGIALFRARVLARWAAALLAVAGVISAALTLLPDAFYRFLAFPNGIAMIGLGVSLWIAARRTTSPAGQPQPMAAGVR